MATILDVKIMFTPKGVYDENTVYERLDFVTSVDSTYLYINQTPSKGKDVLNTDYWMCLADGKPATLASAYATAQGDYAKAQGEAVEGAILDLQTNSEIKSNKTSDIESNKTSVEKYPNVKAVYDFANKLIVDYTHSGNKEVYISSVNTTTDTFTSIGHGLLNGDNVYPVFQDNLGANYASAVLAGGMQTIRAFPGYYIVNKTDDTFQISLTNGGAAIDLTDNTQMDLTKWHFEDGAGGDSYNFTGIPNLKRVKIICSGRVRRPRSALQVSVNGAGTSVTSMTTSSTFDYSSASNMWGNISTYVEISIDTSKLFSIMAVGAKWDQSSIIANSYSEIKAYSVDTRSELSGAEITSIQLINGGLANGASIKIYRA